MASFVPYHGKKRDRLARLESDLRRLIEEEASHEALLEVALQVRDVRIRVLRAKQNKNPERSSAERENFLKLAAKATALRSVTAEQMLAEFQAKVPSQKKKERTE